MRGVAFMGWLLSAPLLGCAWDPPSDLIEPVGSAQGAIVHGTADTTHRAVVAFWGQGNCTASVIEARDDRAFALTAAHCCASDGTVPMKIAVGDNASKPDATFDVVHVLPHPLYNGKDHDFCIMSFVGNPAQIQELEAIPPIMPNEDVLAAGAAIDFIGYGITKEGPGDALRRRVTVELTSVSDIDIVYDQSEGGPCFGDSGGPGLVTVNGTEVIGAVVSKGLHGCTAQGRSGRVSAIYDDFIAPFLAGEASTGSGGGDDDLNARDEIQGEPNQGLVSANAAWSCGVHGLTGEHRPGVIGVFVIAALGAVARLGRGCSKQNPVIH